MAQPYGDPTKLPKARVSFFKDDFLRICDEEPDTMYCVNTYVAAIPRSGILDFTHAKQPGIVHDPAIPEGYVVLRIALKAFTVAIGTKGELIDTVVPSKCRDTYVLIHSTSGHAGIKWNLEGIMSFVSDLKAWGAERAREIVKRQGIWSSIV